MTKITVTGINTNIDTSLAFLLKRGQKIRKELIKGSLSLNVSDGKFINVEQELDINRISYDLKRELCSLLIKIENELNGIENEPSGIKTEVGLDTTKQAANELIESFKEYIAERQDQNLPTILEVEEQLKHWSDSINKNIKEIDSEKLN